MYLLFYESIHRSSIVIHQSSFINHHLSCITHTNLERRGAARTWRSHALAPAMAHPLFAKPCVKHSGTAFVKPFCTLLCARCKEKDTTFKPIRLKTTVKQLRNAICKNEHSFSPSAFVSIVSSYPISLWVVVDCWNRAFPIPLGLHSVLVVVVIVVVLGVVFVVALTVVVLNCLQTV